MVRWCQSDNLPLWETQGRSMVRNLLPWDTNAAVHRADLYAGRALGNTRRSGTTTPIETVAPRFAHSRACVIVFPISDTPFANTRSPWNACVRYPITWVPTWPSACSTFTVMTNRVCSICSADQPKTADVADRERWLDPCQQWGPIRPHWHSKPFPHNAQSAAAKALGQRSERPQVSQSRFHAP